MGYAAFSTHRMDRAAICRYVCVLCEPRPADAAETCVPLDATHTTKRTMAPKRKLRSSREEEGGGNVGAAASAGGAAATAGGARRAKKSKPKKVGAGAYAGSNVRTSLPPEDLLMCMYCHPLQLATWRLRGRSSYTLPYSSCVLGCEPPPLQAAAGRVPTSFQKKYRSFFWFRRVFSVRVS